jgi:type IV pilus assembly protein PilP
MAMFKKEFLHICSGLMVCCIFFIFCTIQSIAAIEDPSEMEETSPAAPAMEAEDTAVDEWEYVFEDRPDPFLPFIEPTVATKNIPEEEEVVLTGMQIFEPGQLTLVAIMFSPKSNIAVVEDVTGKGYILNEGMLIGRHGIVSQITMNQVNITETRTVAGKEITTDIVMRLNKEGDK